MYQPTITSQISSPRHYWGQSTRGWSNFWGWGGCRGLVVSNTDKCGWQWRAHRIKYRWACWSRWYRMPVRVGVVVDAKSKPVLMMWSQINLDNTKSSPMWVTWSQAQGRGCGSRGCARAKPAHRIEYRWGWGWELLCKSELSGGKRKKKFLLLTWSRDLLYRQTRSPACYHVTDSNPRRSKTRSTWGGVLNITSLILFVIVFVLFYFVLNVLLHNHGS